MVVEILAVDDKDFFDRDAGTLEKAYLFGFFVFDGGAAAERIKMVFGEIFLFELRRSRGSLGHRLQAYRIIPAARRKAIQIASDKLEASVVKRGAAVVDQGDPAVEVGGFVVAGNS